MEKKPLALLVLILVLIVLLFVANSYRNKQALKVEPGQTDNAPLPPPPPPPPPVD